MPEILSIGELLDLGNSASTAGLIPYSALEYNGSGDISGISGSAIAGGVDTTIVSAIASSYVESGISDKVDQSAFDNCCSAMSSIVSSKLDASASSMFQPSGDYMEKSASSMFQPSGNYYSASNPSGFLTSADLSSKLDASASSQFAPSGDYVFESSYSSFSGDVINNISSMSSIVSGLTGDYLEKSASSMFAPSGDYALSSDVSSTVDVVANNSASWGQGSDYSGISPVIVDNAERTIGVSSIPLDVDETMTSYVSGGVTYFGVNESALDISSKLDASASSLFQPSGEYYSASNPSGFITGMDLSPYQTIADMSSYALSADVSGVVSAVTNNSGSWGYGGYVETSATEVELGSGNTALRTSFAHGVNNSADYLSFAQGSGNSASGESFVQGYRNWAWNASFAQGFRNSARTYAVAFGSFNSADGGSFAQGIDCTAYVGSVAMGSGLSANKYTTVFGKYNNSGEGSGDSGVAFAIGDGTASSARHDLMLVTKDGEITTYSSTADTVGYRLVSTLKALSAWATANGWTGA